MRVSREISLGSSLHRASTDALINTHCSHMLIIGDLPLPRLAQGGVVYTQALLASSISLTWQQLKQRDCSHMLLLLYHCLS